VKNTILSEYCECNGDFENTLTRKDAEIDNADGINLLNSSSNIKDFLELLNRIATFHQMPLLEV
jgi:hypothetical protein